MEKETLSQHQLSLQYPGRFEITSVVDSGNSLKVLLGQRRNPSTKILITFEDVIYYRSMDECYWIFLPNPTITGIEQDIRTHSIFLTINSVLAKQLTTESGFTTKMFKHFSILGTDNTLDIITPNEPHAERISHAS